MNEQSLRGLVDELLEQLTAAHATRNADALANLYTTDALIYDMAPPLGRRGIDRKHLAQWLGTWEGPVALSWQGPTVIISDDLALVSALCRMRGRQDGRDQDLWYRCTLGLCRLGGRWKIAHEHASVPFYMDGSERAATDLQP